MTYDQALANRIRGMISATSGTTEQPMFGGLAFLVDGHMAVVASRTGGLMVRVDPAMSDDLVATTPTRFAEMRGRTMKGWLRLDAKCVGTDGQLTRWVDLGMACAQALVPKTARDE